MTTTTLIVELPEELLNLLGSPEDAAAKTREILVVEFLREGRLSQGQAARLLGVTRWDILNLMARLGIPSGGETAEEMRREVEESRRVIHRS
jgi:predicted HTH domain antitoxin